MSKKYAMVPVEAMSAGMTPVEYFVYTGLLSYRNKTSGLAWPKRENLAARLGMNERALERPIKSLCTKGWLVPMNTPKPGQTAEYKVILPDEMGLHGVVALDEMGLHDVVALPEDEDLDPETGEMGLHGVGNGSTSCRGMGLHGVVPELTRNLPLTKNHPSAPEGNVTKVTRGDENSWMEVGQGQEMENPPSEKKPFTQEQFRAASQKILYTDWQDFWKYLVGNNYHTKEGNRLNSLDDLKNELRRIR